MIRYIILNQPFFSGQFEMIPLTLVYLPPGPQAAAQHQLPGARPINMQAAILLPIRAKSNDANLKMLRLKFFCHYHSIIKRINRKIDLENEVNDREPIYKGTTLACPDRSSHAKQVRRLFDGI